jgi:DnaJ family protein C protein 11
VVRASQTYLFPIQLAEELVPSAIFYGSIAPFIVYLTVHKLLIEPYQLEKEKKEKEKIRMNYRNK